MGALDILPPEPADPHTRGVSVARVDGTVRAGDAEDRVAVEEPMEIRIAFGPAEGRLQRTATVTMRTPGNDFELAAGLLYAEGMVARSEDIADIRYCGPAAPGASTSNVVRVELAEEVDLELDRLGRNFVSTSSCGVCGKASLEALTLPDDIVIGPGPRVRASVIHGLPAALRRAQPAFEQTGGLHAAGLFDVGGVLVGCREDIGRHNAVDKILGERFLAGAVPLSGAILVVSGRTSFEVVQKALRAAVPILVAVGAPSSLAVDLARRFGMTLIGFARDGRFNVYAGSERVIDG
jgi:FdhD protein